MLVNQPPNQPELDQPHSPKFKEQPELDPLAKKWNKRISHARKHWEKFHKRVRHNQNLVAGFNWEADPKEKEFYQHRANLIQGTISAVLPNIYARNPEISVVPAYRADHLRLFCKTIETVTNKALDKAKLKARAKATVRSALTSSFGVVKVMYQRDIHKDPLIQSRINDAQDNILEIERLISTIEDPQQRGDLDAEKQELNQLLTALQEQAEVVAAEGLVVDRVLTDNLLIDPSVCEFWDYADADWLCQIVPMKRSTAEATYNIKLDKAKSYEDSVDQKMRPKEGRMASGSANLEEDAQIAIMEIWDKNTQSVYTLAEGCDYWLREPYSPNKVGERWFPFFLLPYQVVDGQFVAPSLVDLTERLQAEHNLARDRFNEHRELCLPGWIASGEIPDGSIRRFEDSKLGEITIIDTEGRPLNQFIAERNHPKIDPAVYDTTAVRYDWEQVTGLQDAARSTVVKPKTATEASILNQSLSGRVSEFRDQVEDWLQEIAQYSAQILLQEMTPIQVERIMGAPDTEMQMIKGFPVEVEIPRFSWPTSDKEQIFSSVEMTIRAGTTGAPDKLEQQESWGKLLPIIQGQVQSIIQLKAQGLDAEPIINLLKETVKRFDERLDVEQFIPSAPAMPPGLPGMAPGLPGMPTPDQAPAMAAEPAVPPMQ